MSAIAVATFSPAAPHEPTFRELCVSKHPDAPASHLYGAEPAATVVFIPTSPKSPAIIFMSSALPWQTIAFPLSFTTLSNRSAVAAEMPAWLKRLDDETEQTFKEVIEPKLAEAFPPKRRRGRRKG